MYCIEIVEVSVSLWSKFVTFIAMHACMHALFVFVHEVCSKKYLKIKLFLIPLAGIPLTYDDLDYEDKISTFLRKMYMVMEIPGE